MKAVEPNNHFEMPKNYRRSVVLSTKTTSATFILGFPTKSSEYTPRITMHEEPISTLKIKLKLENFKRKREAIQGWKEAMERVIMMNL